jgi:hypothetical protein
MTSYGGRDGNPGGPGGKRQRITPRSKPQGQTSHNKPPSKSCCSMVEAGRSVRRGKYRLAWRYARLSVRLIAGRI